MRHSVKQVKFIEIGESERFIGGILLNNGDVICGCCGGIFKNENKGKTWDIIEEFENWVDFSEEII